MTTSHISAVMPYIIARGFNFSATSTSESALVAAKKCCRITGYLDKLAPYPHGHVVRDLQPVVEKGEPPRVLFELLGSFLYGQAYLHVLGEVENRPISLEIDGNLHQVVGFSCHLDDCLLPAIFCAISKSNAHARNIDFLKWAFFMRLACLTTWSSVIYSNVLDSQLHRGLYLLGMKSFKPTSSIFISILLLRNLYFVLSKCQN